MKFFQRTLFILMFIVLSSALSHGAETIRVAGSGGMIPLVTELARAYMAENRNVVVDVNQKSIQSAGGIMGTAEGRLEIGMANRELKDREKSLGIETFEIARVAVVVGVNKSVKLRDMTSEALCGVYTGKAISWKDLGGPDERIIALTKPESDSTKETVRKKVKCFSEIKEPESVIRVQTSPETGKALANRPNSIGFVDSVTVDDYKGDIISLKMDGVAPTPENVRSGKYRLTQTYSLVTKGRPSGAVKGFIDFVRGPRGRTIIEDNKAVALK